MSVRSYVLGLAAPALLRCGGRELSLSEEFVGRDMRLLGIPRAFGKKGDVVASVNFCSNSPLHRDRVPRPVSAER